MKMRDIDKQKEDMMYEALDKARKKKMTKKTYVYHYIAYLVECSYRTVERWIKKRGIKI